MVVNKAYQELAEHYRTAILPARVHAPKDYPQNHIIFKNRPNSLAYNELSKQD
jgi:hypothetical protein